MRKLEGLKPEKVWYFFEEISKIPRGSHNEKAVSDYCVQFAKERELEVYQDDAWNVVIRKGASKGYEKAEPMILQGHLDMVCEKKADCTIDFERDGLDLKVEGDFVSAEGTTLGGDDGIAIAYALAILDDDSIAHPSLEVVFTACEEMGMDGARALDVSVLRGHTVLNLDSEEEGILLAGCAGGCTAAITIPVQREEAQGVEALLLVNGLSGGHSGAEIDKGRGNANVLLGRILGSLSKKLSFSILSLFGGEKDNAIPRQSKAKLLLPDSKIEQAVEICKICENELKTEYAFTDSKVEVTLEIFGQQKAQAFDGDSQKRVLALLMALPNGVQTMSQNIKGLVETSLNLGILKTEEDRVSFSYSIRSSIGSAKERLLEKMQIIAEYFGGALAFHGDYPAWEYRKNSKLREDMFQIYCELFGKEPKVEVIHAGLECGILSSKIPDLDCVSIGPDILDIHTTRERISISSVERTWRYLLKILESNVNF